MLELLTTSEMSRADKLTIERGTPGLTLMEAAGRGASEELLAHYPEAQKILILCGPGNNGGDGFVMARYLKAQGRMIRLVLSVDRTDLHGDAALMADRFEGEIEPLTANTLGDEELIVDGLFGSGLKRPIEGKVAALIRATNEQKTPVFSIDIPSGIEGRSGSVLGCAFKAAMTVTFFRPKTGHYLYPGRAYCGQLSVIDIGISAAVLDEIKPTVFLNSPDLWSGVFPTPSYDSHKYQRGFSVILSGGKAATGAARLAARGALRIGSGLVTVASPLEAVEVNAAHLTSIMVHPFEGVDGFREILADRRKNAVLIGPGAGIGQETREIVHVALKTEAHLLLDADALRSFSGDPLGLFQGIKRREASTVMTPHGGEFAALFQEGSSEEKTATVSKIETARAAARKSGAIIIFKGPDTVIAEPQGRAVVNANAPPTLATAGSGDVLAGFVTGLLAQNMPAFEAASAAAWLHGSTAEAFGAGLIAEDLPEGLPNSLGSGLINVMQFCLARKV